MIDGVAVTKIADSTFKGQKFITSISIPAIEVSGNETFENCIGLESITFAHEVDFDDLSEAFRGCIKLKEINIPASVNRVFTDFYRCNVEKIWINNRYLYECAIPEWDSGFGFLFSRVKTINVLAIVADTYENEYFNDATIFDKSEKTEIDGIEYYIYTRK